MAKKTKNNQIIFLVAAVFGILALVMFLLPTLTYKNEVSALGVSGYNKVDFSGINLIFGASEVKGVTYNTITKSTTEYSFGAEVSAAIGVIISAVLSIAGLVCLLISKVIDKKNAKVMKLVAFIGFAAAAVVLVALTKTTFFSANEIENESVKGCYKLAIGAYLACGFNGVAAIGSLVA